MPKLFEDYVPEIIEYDPSIDGGRPTKQEYIAPKREKKETNLIKISQEKKQSVQELLKDYKPEVLIYDPEVDGSDEHMTREDHLSTKELLAEKIRSAKAARKNNQTTFRQNIRTENEQK